MDKGTRVQISKGPSQGKTGSVFWKGPNKYGSGERLGVRGDDGETYWVNTDMVEASDTKEPEAEEGPTFEKGARVSFKWRGREGTGSVFWIGQSKSGPGQRLGIRDDHPPEGGEDAVWCDARFAKALDAEEEARIDEARSAAPQNGPQPVSDDEELPAEAFAPSVGMDEMPEPPPAEDYPVYEDDEDVPF